MNQRYILSGLVVLTVVSLIGCLGGGEGAADRKPTHSVTGTVTMSGGPVANASVTFSPQEGQPSARARTDSSGKYSLTTYEANDGAVAGKYKVLVSQSSVSGGSGGTMSHEAYTSGAASSGHASSRSEAAAKEKAGVETTLPEKYAAANTTPLEANVEAGKENVVDLTLEP